MHACTLAGITLGGFRFPVSVPQGDNNPGFIDWLYLDEDLRITRGSKGSLFVHRREEPLEGASGDII